MFKKKARKGSQSPALVTEIVNTILLEKRSKALGDVFVRVKEHCGAATIKGNSCIMIEYLFGKVKTSNLKHGFQKLSNHHVTLSNPELMISKVQHLHRILRGHFLLKAWNRIRIFISQLIPK